MRYPSALFLLYQLCFFYFALFYFVFHVKLITHAGRVRLHMGRKHQQSWWRSTSSIFFMVLNTFKTIEEKKRITEEYLTQ